MSVDNIYSFLYSWADQILNTEQSLGILIIQSHQNAPAPTQDDPYIVIDYAPNQTRIGRPSAGDVDEGTGERTLVDDFILVVEIWEVNSNGSLLTKLLTSLNRQDIKDLWKANDFAFYTESEVINMPRVSEDDEWKRESMVELTIGTAEGTTELTRHIEDVEYEGTIPAQGRPGDHILEDTVES